MSADYEYDDWIDCPYCGGSGVIEGECTCMDDCCCCLEPDAPECDHCNGKGGWNADDNQ